MLPGMSLNRTAIAAAGTLLALAVLAFFALRAGGAEPPTTAAATAGKPEVRREVVRRTVHVRRPRGPGARTA